MIVQDETSSSNSHCFLSIIPQHNDKQTLYKDIGRCQDETRKRQMSKRCFKNDLDYHMHACMHAYGNLSHF